MSALVAISDFLFNSFWGSVIMIGLLLAIFFAAIYFIRRWKNFQRSLNLVFLRVLIPKKDSKEDKEDQRDKEKDFKETVGVMTQLLTNLHSMCSSRLINKIIGQDFFSLEYVVAEGLIYFYVVIPRDFQVVAEKQITAFYPDAVVDKVPEYNIFEEKSYQANTYRFLTKEYSYAIRTIQRLESDPLNAITNVFSKIGNDEGAAIQIMLRPVPNKWQKHGRKLADSIFIRKAQTNIFHPFRWIVTLISIMFHGHTGGGEEKSQAKDRVAPQVEDLVKAMEEKNTKVGYDCIIRLITSAPSEHQAKAQLQAISSSFIQFNSTDNNSFDKTRYHSPRFLTTQFIFRSFQRGFLMWWIVLRHFQLKQILSAEEVATLFHFPNIKYNKAPNIKWQDFKILPAPPNTPTTGLFLGNNTYRGDCRKVFILPDDRRRHFYSIGKSGTGKSTILETMIKQDMQNGHGIAVIDPHGDLIEAVLPHVPRNRADDVIVFDPGDLDRPMGLNILEAKSADQKEFIAQEALAIFIKMFGEEIMGPRLQHYFRNGCLTLLEDDKEGATLIDLPRLFIDEAWQRYKVSKVTNPVVKSFWTKEMASSGQREKQEIIPYFSSKFGPFVTNAQIRNIIGQTKSGFDFRRVMDDQKILLVNLSKGKTGELNSQLLGMIMVAKLQMSAMSRVDTPENDRKDFYMYVDEFQNFVTDSFASILSEARKYRLNLIIAHQYISQITKTQGGGKGKQEDTTIRDAVFGNVGSMMCFKIGAQDAEVMAKEFAPAFTEQDLINIANYKACIKLNINNATSRGFTLETVYDPLGKDYDAAQAYKQLSRLKYARDRDFVDKEIQRRVGL